MVFERQCHFMNQQTELTEYADRHMIVIVVTFFFILLCTFYGFFFAFHRMKKENSLINWFVLVESAKYKSKRNAVGKLEMKLCGKAKA